MCADSETIKGEGTCNRSVTPVMFTHTRTGDLQRRLRYSAKQVGWATHGFKPRLRGCTTLKHGHENH